MKELFQKYAIWVLLLLVVVMFLPWLGETLFNTKGEPREAIVAMSMIDSGNWILPVSFGCEIPYKPPFLAWCIVIASYLTGGISEFASRLPSAISAIVLALATYRFYYRCGGCRRIAFVTAVVMVTTVEVWRAASACRVDMVLTAFMVCAIYSLYGFFEERKRRLPWLAILLMSGALLTKGPVGVFLPCLVIGVYRLIRGDRFLPLFGRLVASGILSCIIPALWYYAAYQQGGQAFLDLVIEENFGRLTGTMSYESHVNPWWYNFLTVFAGMAPYTLMAVISLFAINGIGNVRKTLGSGSWSERCRAWWSGFRNLDPVVLYSIVTVALIFIFYCFPKSKRSVYLLPIYPFLAYFVTLLIFKMIDVAKRYITVYNFIIASLAVVMPIVVGFLIPGLVGTTGALIAIGCFLVGVASLWSIFKCDTMKSSMAMLLSTVAIYVTLNATILPPILSSKSQKPVAEALTSDCPDGEIYSFVNEPLLRFYEVNYYMRDRLRVFDEEMPESGLLIVSQNDYDALIDRFGDQYEFVTIKDYKRPAPILSHRTSTTRLLSFNRR